MTGDFILFINYSPRRHEEHEEKKIKKVGAVCRRISFLKSRRKNGKNSVILQQKKPGEYPGFFDLRCIEKIMTKPSFFCDRL